MLKLQQSFIILNIITMGVEEGGKKVGGIGVFALQSLDYFHISCGLVEQVSLCFHFGSTNNSHVP